MSFSSEIKQELCNLPLENTCCQRAELAGLLALSGTLIAESDGGGVRLRTENAHVAKRAFTLLSGLFSVHPKRMAVEKKNEGYIHTIHLYEHDNFVHIMKALGFWRDGRAKFSADPFVTGESCCRRAFLRGAFLGAGSVSAPQKSYHLEIETHYHRLSGDILQLFEDESLKARRVMRKSNHVIYMKESEEIADALAALGATDSALTLYHIKVEKDMKNRINRQVNCETANLTKIANTAAVHIKAIQRVLQSPLREELTPAMHELALLRLQNPESSLAELAQALSEPLSKSGVSRRLQKFVDLAEKLPS